MKPSGWLVIDILELAAFLAINGQANGMTETEIGQTALKQAGIMLRALAHPVRAFRQDA